jgi:hypothetical protein
MLQNFVIPKSQDLDSFVLKISRAFRVVFSLPLLYMSSTIKFHGQLLLEAKEVNDVFSYCVLASELETSYASIAK